VLLRVGSRGSRLALTQAELAASRLRRPGLEIALMPITTAGDRDRTKPFGEIGSRGVFVKEIEEALLDGRIDVAVHSAKDMTSSDAAGLVVGAYLEREDPRDALCGADELRPGMRVGTASVRRRAQLLSLEPELSIEPLRGNIDTRLRKRGERGLDAVVLAACGLDRLGLSGEIGLRLGPEQVLPEAGQGALALQVRAGEEELVGGADHPETRRRVEAERACVFAIGGAAPRAGGRVPRRRDPDRALVAAEDGSWVERRSGGDPRRPTELAAFSRRDGIRHVRGTHPQRGARGELPGWVGVRDGLRATAADDGRRGGVIVHTCARADRAACARCGGTRSRSRAVPADRARGIGPDETLEVDAVRLGGRDQPFGAGSSAARARTLPPVAAIRAGHRRRSS
jgi:hydroxymethylbilane synthase